MHNVISIRQLTADSSHFHRLLDSGAGERLEEIAGVRIIRPEPMAVWNRARPGQWETAAGRYDAKSGEWTFNPGFDARTDLHFSPMPGLTCRSSLLSSGHIGVFPEHLAIWNQLRTEAANEATHGALNLFGYTGIASLALQSTGCAVTHVDASKPALTHASANQQLSQLDPGGVRWIADDAMKFARREVRRERRYSILLADPPAFGRGPKGEVWRIEESLGELIDLAAQLLDEERHLFVLSYYAVRLSPSVVAQMMANAFPRSGIHVNELGLREEWSGRFLPQCWCLMAREIAKPVRRMPAGS